MDGVYEDNPTALMNIARSKENYAVLLMRERSEHIPPAESLLSFSENPTKTDRGLGFLALALGNSITQLSMLYCDAFLPFLQNTR